MSPRVLQLGALGLTQQECEGQGGAFTPPGTCVFAGSGAGLSTGQVALGVGLVGLAAVAGANLVGDTRRPTSNLAGAGLGALLGLGGVVLYDRSRS